MLSTVLLFIISFTSFSQTPVPSSSITPSTSGAYCPNQTITIAITINAANIRYADVYGVADVAGGAAPNVVSPLTQYENNGATVIQFNAQFIDLNAPQSFRIHFDYPAQESSSRYLTGSADFTYNEIKSFHTPTVYSTVTPNQTSITAPRCTVSNFTINFPQAQFSDPYLVPELAYFPISTYQYLLPANWQLNGVTSTGTNWISGTNSVTVTSDLSTGDGSSIQIRAVNACGAGLYTAPISQIPISRPAPVLSITSTGGDFCSGTRIFTLTGLPSTASVCWSISNTSLASIPASSCSPSVTVTRVGSSSGDLVLTGTVTDCGTFTYPVTQTIRIGSPSTSGLQIFKYMSPNLCVINNPSSPGLNTFVLSNNSSTGSTIGYQTGNSFGAIISTTPSQLTVNGIATIPKFMVQKAASNTNSFLYVQSRIENTCGWSDWKTIQLNICPANITSVIGTQNPTNITSVIVAPNPAKNLITIKTSLPNYADVLSIKSEGNKLPDAKPDVILIYDIILRDALGNTRKTLHLKSGVTSLNFSIENVPNGIYFLSIFDGRKWDTQKLLVQK